jgi:hypothetical protein
MHQFGGELLYADKLVARLVVGDYSVKHGSDGRYSWDGTITSHVCVEGQRLVEGIPYELKLPNGKMSGICIGKPCRRGLAFDGDGLLPHNLMADDA